MLSFSHKFISKYLRCNWMPWLCLYFWYVLIFSALYNNFLNILGIISLKLFIRCWLYDTWIELYAKTRFQDQYLTCYRANVQPSSCKSLPSMIYQLLLVQYRPRRSDSKRDWSDSVRDWPRYSRSHPETGYISYEQVWFRSRFTCWRYGVWETLRNKSLVFGIRRITGAKIETWPSIVKVLHSLSMTDGYLARNGEYKCLWSELLQ